MIVRVTVAMVSACSCGKFSADSLTSSRGYFDAHTETSACSIRSLDLSYSVVL